MPHDHEITLAHSADADDVFMWWPLTGKVDPANPARLLSRPVIDTQGLRFIAIPEDISVLNKRAIASGDLDVTAISFAAYARCADRYALASVGSSFGDNFGPKVVTVESNTAMTVESLAVGQANARIAVPGLQTSAFMALSLLLGDAAAFTPVEVPFDRVADTVRSGEADAGVLIHEAQYTYQQQGLRLVSDLGQWWTTKTGLPMPLGANAVSKSLDHRLGPGGVRRVVGLLKRSLDHALANRDESLKYARTFSPLKDDATLDAYVRRYVNAFTVDARGDGLKSVELLLSTAFRRGLLPASVTVEMIGP